MSHKIVTIVLPGPRSFANLIAPAFFIDNNEKMRVSAFIDTGNIYAKSSNIKLGDIRMSTGLGFAYLSPEQVTHLSYNIIIIDN